MSSQTEWQRRQLAASNCQTCGAPRPLNSSKYCVLCLVKNRERQRARKGFKRRYRSISYVLEAMAR